MIFSQRTLFALVGTVLIAVLLAYGGKIYMDRVNEGREREALACARQLGLAATQYAQDHNSHYPHAGRWEMELIPYLAPNAARVLHPPAPIGGTLRRFSLNPAFAGKSMAQVPEPADTWMFYESVAQNPSASDDLDYWPDPSHDGGHLFAVAYGDGHCYSRPAEWKQSVRQHLLGL